MRARLLVERLTERMHHPGDEILVRPGLRATVVAVDRWAEKPYTVVVHHSMGESKREISAEDILRQ